MHFLAAGRRAGVRTVAVFLTALVCAGSVGWGHTAWDDPACDPIPVQHDHSAHRLAAQTQQTPPAEGHCYLCHALRLLHVALAAHPADAPQTSSASLYRVDAPLSVSQAIAGATRPRAPPVALL